MNRTLARRLAALALAAVAVRVAAEARAAERVTDGGSAPAYRFQVLSENDGSFLKPNELEDRHYTNGAALDFAHKSDTLQGWVDALGLPNSGTAAGIFVAHEIYTPEDLSRENPDPDDRPYAGYLYGGVYAQREADGGYVDHLDHLQLNLGVVGPSSLAEEVQDYIHENFSGDDPMGWDAQLGDELAVNLVYRRVARWSLTRQTSRYDSAHRVGDDGRLTAFDQQAEPVEGFDLELLPYGELRLGTTHRDATVGGLLRVGWKLPDDFGPAQVRDPGSFTGAGPQRGWSAYAFAGAAARYVEWNTFLQGNYERDPSPAVQPVPFIGIFRGGVAVAYTGNRFAAELSYAQSYRTREFIGQRDADSIGQLAATLSWGF